MTTGMRQKQGVRRRGSVIVPQGAVVTVAESPDVPGETRMSPSPERMIGVKERLAYFSTL